MDTIQHIKEQEKLNRPMITYDLVRNDFCESMILSLIRNIKENKMFRIKKDKPLEDLKDFGFYYNDNIGQYVYNFINSPLTVNVWNRKVNISDNNCLTNNILSAIIYKLTKLGYLEYIEDKGE